MRCSREQIFPSVNSVVLPIRSRIFDVLRLRVCLVNHNTTRGRVLEHYARSWGMISQSADNEAQALGVLEQAAERGEPFDLAILDWQLPDRGGMALAQRIKANRALANTRLVLLTAFGERGDGEIATKVGLDAYLSTPIHHSQLFDCLCLVMGKTTRQSLDSSAGGASLITRFSLSETRGRLNARVLVVEDNVVNQKVAVRMLEKFGCRPDVVASGEEAVEVLARITYDLVLMDCMMPEMDGYEATRIIREREANKNRETLRGMGDGKESTSVSPPPSPFIHHAGVRRVPIIAMTGNAMKGDREECLAAGMDDYLSKPVKPAELKKMLATWLPKHDNHRTSQDRSSTQDF